jgi:acyl-CoA thioesterase
VPAGGPSLDHAFSSHRAAPVDGWLLVDNRPLRVGDARGTHLGSMRDRTGDLGAVLRHDVLLRMPSPHVQPQPTDAPAVAS